MRYSLVFSVVAALNLLISATYPAKAEEANSCSLELENIAKYVKGIIHPHYLPGESDLGRKTFVELAHQTRNLEVRIEECADYYFSKGKAKTANDLERAMEAIDLSSDFRSARLDVVGLSMQLEAAAESYDFWIFRPLVFKTEMWRKVYREYLEKHNLN